MASLKEVSPSIVKYVNDMWEKSLTTGQAVNTATPENPIHPYTITSVQQVQPSRQQMELFETRRNQLDKLMPAGKKLETYTCFYNPTSESQLKKIIQTSWKEVFGGNPDQLTFITNANEAANSNRVQYFRTIVVRVCLGREGVDYSQPSKGHIKIRDLDGVSTSFVVTYRNANDPASHVHQSPLKDSTSSLGSSSGSISSPSSANSTPTKSTSSVTSVASPNKSTTPAGVMPGGLIGNGINCPSCQKPNAGNTRYCIRCGANL